jgi:hypothetical protein
MPETRASSFAAYLQTSYTLCRLSTLGKKATDEQVSLQTLRVLEVFLEDPTVQLAGAECTNAAVLHRELAGVTDMIGGSSLRKQSYSPINR